MVTLKSGTTQGCTLSPCLFNTVLEFLATGKRKQKEIKGIQMEKKNQNFTFTDDMLLYIITQELYQGTLTADKQ